MKFYNKGEIVCAKNKIDAVKAACKSAAKKLAVLSLAVAVNGGAVASAQIPGDQAQSIARLAIEKAKEAVKKGQNATKIEEDAMRARAGKVHVMMLLLYMKILKGFTSKL